MSLDDNILSTRDNDVFMKYINNHKSTIGSGTETHQYIKNTHRLNFTIDDKEYDDFIKLYRKNIKTTHFGLMEKTNRDTSLYLDFDIKYKKNERLFTIIEIEQIIKIINTLINKLFDIQNDNDSDNSENETSNKDLIKAFLLIKDDPIYNKEKELYCDGFHIQYPYLILNKYNKILLFDKIREKLINNECIKNICNKTKCDIDSIFDKKVISDTKWWFLYKSGKTIINDGIINESIYKVIKIFNYYCIENPLEKSNTLIKILSLRQPNIKINILTKSKYINEYEIISNSFNKNKKQSGINYFMDVDKNNEIQEIKLIPDDGINIKNILNKNIMSNEEFASKLVDLYSVKRATDYNTWIAVGWALYNISPRLLNAFHFFSKKSLKYCVSSCNKVWKDCESYNGDGRYKISSLSKWAIEDNYTKFLEIKFEKTTVLFELIDFTKEFDICTIIHNYYGDDFICYDLEKNLWAMHENHRWFKLQKAQDLNLKLATEFIVDVAKIAGIFNVKGSSIGGANSDIFLEKAKYLNLLIKKLKENDYREKLIKECSLIFFDKYDNFQEKLNENINVIGFNNGIYDLKQMKFRKGIPEDYNTFTTKYNYIEYSLDHEYVIYIEKFFKMVLVDDKLVTYVLCYIASLLKGGNIDQILMFWTGTGANGKGTINKFIDALLGDLFSTVKIELLTRKTGNANEASPALSDKQGKRLLSMQESDAGDKLQLGFMKSLTGGDKIQARGIFERPIYFIPQFKIIISCNEMPELGFVDGGTSRRLKVVKFTQKFVDNPTKSNEHKINKNVDNELFKMKGAFMWLLINKYYPMYIDIGLSNLEPECVQVATKSYREDSNIILDFLNENYIRTDNEKQIILIDDVWNLFGEWYKTYTGNSNTKSPYNKKKFIELLGLMDLPMNKLNIKNIIVNNN